MIKVHKGYSVVHNTIYTIYQTDTEKLKTIMKQYSIEIPANCRIDHMLIFYKEELEDIEKQYKLARKQERQTK